MPSTQAAFLSLSLKLHQLLVAVRIAANRARIIAWSRVRDDVGLTNQVCALKTGSGIQKSRRAVRLPFQSTFKITEDSKLKLAIPCTFRAAIILHYINHDDYSAVLSKMYIHVNV